MAKKEPRRYKVKLSDINRLRSNFELVDPERGPENKISNRRSDR